MAKRTELVWGAKSFVPEVFHAPHSGVRSSIAKLIQDIDPESAEFASVCEVLLEMRNAEVEIDDAAVAIAVRLGRQRYARGQERTATPPKRVSAGLPARLWPEQGDEPSIVYYIRRGKLIKIGTTIQPENRFRDLVPDEILAWEPGGRPEEQARHRQFAHLRQNGEYFRPGTDLKAHCRMLRKSHGDPDPRWRSGDRLASEAPESDRLQLPPPTNPDLVTASQAASILGIKRSTIASWVHRKFLVAVDGRTRPLYYLDHIRALDERRRRSWDNLAKGKE